MARPVNAAAVKAGYAQKARGSLGAAGDGTSRCGLGPRLTRDRVGDPARSHTSSAIAATTGRATASGGA
ncbi:hypothetical protein SALBM311S_06152 [Streptomyces alboniger]